MTAIRLIIVAAIFLPGIPLSHATSVGPDRKVLSFAVSLPAPPSRIFKMWNPFVKHLETVTGHEIHLLTPRGLNTLEQQFEDEKIDFIYINSYAYYLYHQKGLLEAVAQMRNKAGHVTSRGRVLVRRDSGISQLDDLRGGRLSLISPHGAGSYLAPRAMLKQHGLEMEKDIDVTYSGDLKKSVYDVLLNEATAAVMCGVNYDIINTKLDLQDIFVMQLTDEFPEAVIAVRRGIDPALKEQIRTTIINMTNSIEGRRALSKLRNTKVYDFITYDPAIENKTRALLNKANL